MERKKYSVKAVACIDDFCVVLPERYVDKFVKADLQYIRQKHLVLVYGGKKTTGEEVFQEIRFEPRKDKSQ
jgi:hypothetical protein